MLEYFPGGVCSGGVSAPGGSVPGGCLFRGDGLLPGGVCCQGGLLPVGGRGCLLGGVWSRGIGIPACSEADPPVNRMTDRCKNITLATTSLRPVITGLTHYSIVLDEDF